MHLTELYQPPLKRHPEKTAVIFEEETWTYRQLDEAIRHSASTLQALGIRRGDRVALFMKNRVELILLYFACFRIGAIAVPLNNRYQTDEVLYASRHCEPKILLVEGRLEKVTQGIDLQVESLERILVVGGNKQSPGESWEDHLAKAPTIHDSPQLAETDPSVILYTSGSTGKPKGVTHTHRSVTQGALNRVRTQELTEDEIQVVGLSISHVGGFMGQILPMLHAGGTIVLLDEFYPGPFLTLFEKHRPSRLLLLPTQLLEILEHPRAKEISFRSLKETQSAGDVVTHDLYQRFFKLTGFTINQFWGMTECEGFCLSPAFGEIRRGSIGKAQKGNYIRLVDHEEKDVPIGKIGEMLVKGDTVMKTYWKDPKNTKKAFWKGWLKSGDLAHQDEEGFFFFRGRIKEIIIKGGSNVSPGEVEEVLDDHPSVEISGVVGVPHEHYGNLIHAFIVPEPNIDPAVTVEALSQFASKRLAAYKVPDHWTFVEDIPRNQVGKIDRRGLHVLAAHFRK